GAAGGRRFIGRASAEGGSCLMPDLLLEIGCEEIPARMLDAAWNDLAQRLTSLLLRESLWKDEPSQPEATGVGFRPCATPRRLALFVPSVAPSQADVTEQVTGPSLKVAFKDGKPTPAAEAFAKKAGIEVSKLEKITSPKGEYLVATITRKG